MILIGIVARQSASPMTFPVCVKSLFPAKPEVRSVLISRLRLELLIDERVVVRDSFAEAKSGVELESTFAGVKAVEIATIAGKVKAQI